MPRRSEFPADPIHHQENPDPHRPLRRSLSVPAIVSISLIVIAVMASPPCHSADLTPDGLELPPPELSTLVEAGPVIAIASDLGLQPQIGCFRDLPGAWQAGMQARIAFGGGPSGYDVLPQVDVSLRKLWMGDEGAEPIRNSEYFGASLGGFFAYDFDGGKAGLKPYGTLSLGKYWMPFDNQPFGLDLNLELTRYFSGHLPGRSELVFITMGVHLFYTLP